MQLGYYCVTLLLIHGIRFLMSEATTLLLIHATGFLLCEAITLLLIPKLSNLELCW